MKFAKYQVNGNDFIITLDQIQPDDIKLLADRKFGIGCDQLILLSQTEDRVFDVSFWNQDGSYAKMCGNGSCAVVAYVQRFLDEKITNCKLKIDGKVYEASIENKIVSVVFPLPEFVLKTSEYKIISTGNLHLIYLTAIDKATEQLALDFQNEHKDCNIHFVETLENNMLRLKTFERGVGWTKACGSGAISSAFSLEQTGKFQILHDGGMSEVTITENAAVLKTIPTAVFSGELL